MKRLHIAYQVLALAFVLLSVTVGHGLLTKLTTGANTKLQNNTEWLEIPARKGSQ